MNQCQSLAKLDDTFQHKLKRLRRIATASSPLSDPCDKNSTAYVVVEAYNSWTLFTRAFCLSCILGTKTKSGSKVTTTYSYSRNLNDVIYESTRIFKSSARSPVPRRDELPWQASASIIRLSSHWNFSNFASISAGLSLSPDTLKHLKDFRNFIAHRNDDTFGTSSRWSRYYGIIGIEHPIPMLQAHPYGRPQTLILDWLDNVSNTADEMCK